MAQRSVGSFNFISSLSMSSSASLHCFLKKEKLANRKIWSDSSGLLVSGWFKQFKGGFQIGDFFAMSAPDTWPVPDSTGLTGQFGSIFKTMEWIEQLI